MCPIAPEIDLGLFALYNGTYRWNRGYVLCVVQVLKLK